MPVLFVVSGANSDDTNLFPADESDVNEVDQPSADSTVSSTSILFTGVPTTSTSTAVTTVVTPHTTNDNISTASSSTNPDITPDITTSTTESPPLPPGTLRIVAVSDTHGMERLLTGRVPDGDIFIHAGDYAADKGKDRSKIKALDQWMEKLPHPLKIVVRGNHDPHDAHFPLSKAIHISSSRMVKYKGISISLAPHGCKQVPFGHVVVSHEPPYGILDKVFTRRKNHVGSKVLHNSIERFSKTMKPQLWLMGHIHEGFGAIEVAFKTAAATTKFSSDRTPPLLKAVRKVRPIAGIGVTNTGYQHTVPYTTLCVNVANANSGPAHSIVNMPVCIDVINIHPEE